jgi:hypothetical protein
MGHSSPPAPGEHGANSIRQYVGGIPGCALKDCRANDLKQRSPPKEMAEDFSGRGRQIVTTQAKPSMRQQRDGKRAWDQQCVVEPIVEEGNMDVRLDQPAIARVERASRHKQRVTHVSKPLHSNASMISPNPSPIAIFRSKTIPLLVAHRTALRQTFYQVGFHRRPVQI